MSQFLKQAYDAGCEHALKEAGLPRSLMKNDNWIQMSRRIGDAEQLAGENILRAQAAAKGVPHVRTRVPTPDEDAVMSRISAHLEGQALSRRIAGERKLLPSGRPESVLAMDRQAPLSPQARDRQIALNQEDRAASRSIWPQQQE